VDRFGSLKSWIQTQHLEHDALLSYRESFQTHSARLLVLKQFLQVPVAERLHKFLRDEAEYRIEYGLYSNGDEAASEEAWLHADEKNRFFRFSKLVGAPPEYNMSPNMLTYLRFRKAFQDPGFQIFFQELSGMQLGWSDDFGSHSMATGDFLKPHSDDNRNRGLALVIYLSDWRPNFGGALHVVDSQGRRTSIEPEYNSLVVFDVAAGTTHSVEPITAEADNVRRLTIGGWYHKAAAAGDQRCVV
jgi:hypothetical protein